jgi:hypothetical protein
MSAGTLLKARLPDVAPVRTRPPLAHGGEVLRHTQPRMKRPLIGYLMR